jgi:hypothetical protein
MEKFDVDSNVVVSSEKVIWDDTGKDPLAIASTMIFVRID